MTLKNLTMWLDFFIYPNKMSSNSEILSDSSNFHYKYDKLKDINKSNLQKGCLNRWGDKDRSEWDKIQRMMVFGKRVGIPPIPKRLVKEWKKY